MALAKVLEIMGQNFLGRHEASFLDATVVG
jgi:hypothetical protein